MTQKDLKDLIKRKFLKNAKKIRGKFPPISETVEGIVRTWKIKSVHTIKNKKGLFLITIKDPSSTPKMRYFLASILASQSSDLLVLLAREEAINEGLKLIQYSIPPESFNVSLLSLKELFDGDKLEDDIKNLENFRTAYRKKLERVKKISTNT
ncbi:MAG: hypothetical protein ACTSYC_04995 [Promethearchaeota archaeon]